MSCESTPTLKLYNWGEYIDDELVAAFEEESGYKVKQIAFDSNEVAITQIKAGNQYDMDLHFLDSMKEGPVSIITSKYDIGDITKEEDDYQSQESDDIPIYPSTGD